MTRTTAIIAAVMLIVSGGIATAGSRGTAGGGQPAFNQPSDVKQAPAAIRQACHAYWDAVNNRGTPEFVQCVRAKLHK